MKLNVKVEGSTEENGKFRIYLKINNNPLTSILFEENEIQNDNIFQSSLKKKLKSKELDNKEFVIEI